MDLTDYVRALRRRWLLMLLCVLVSVGASVALTVTTEPTYSSTARLFISSSQGTTTEALQGAQLSAARITSYAEMIATPELANTVSEQLGGDLSGAALRPSVTAEVLEETFIIEVAARNQDPTKAQQVAQAYAEGLAAMIEDLELSTVAGEQFIKATVYQAALVPTSPIAPRPTRNVALGLLVGVVLALCAAVVRELLDNTVRGGPDLAKVSDLPLLGDVPFDPAARG